MELRLLEKTDAQTYHALRLRALQEHPEAFGAAYEDEKLMSLEAVAGRLQPMPERFMLGAWLEGDLVGMAGFGRALGKKTRHRGGIYSMYVAPEARGQRMGRALLAEMIQRVRALPELEEIILAVTVGNGAARSIYIAAGFIPSYIEPRYLKIDNHYYDIEWMTLHL